MGDLWVMEFNLRKLTEKAMKCCLKGRLSLLVNVPRAAVHSRRSAKMDWGLWVLNSCRGCLRVVLFCPYTLPVAQQDICRRGLGPGSGSKDK